MILALALDSLDVPSTASIYKSTRYKDQPTPEPGSSAVELPTLYLTSTLKLLERKGESVFKTWGKQNLGHARSFARRAPALHRCAHETWLCTPAPRLYHNTQILIATKNSPSGIRSTSCPSALSVRRSTGTDALATSRRWDISHCKSSPFRFDSLASSASVVTPSRRPPRRLFRIGPLSALPCPSGSFRQQAFPRSGPASRDPLASFHAPFWKLALRNYILQPLAPRVLALRRERYSPELSHYYSSTSAPSDHVLTAQHALPIPS